MLDQETVAEMARERLTEKGEAEAGLTIPRLMALVPDAVKRLCREAALLPATRLLLTKTFTLEAIGTMGGAADLAPALMDAEPLLLDLITRASVSISAGDPVADVVCMPAPDRFWQQIEAAGRASYAVEDGAMYVKGPQGAWDGLVLLRRAPCVASLLRIEEAGLDERLIGIVAAMATQVAENQSTTKGPKKP